MLGREGGSGEVPGGVQQDGGEHGGLGVPASCAQGWGGRLGCPPPPAPTGSLPCMWLAMLPPWKTLCRWEKSGGRVWRCLDRGCTAGQEATVCVCRLGGMPWRGPGEARAAQRVRAWWGRKRKSPCALGCQPMPLTLALLAFRPTSTGKGSGRPGSTRQGPPRTLTSLNSSREQMAGPKARAGLNTPPDTEPPSMVRGTRCRQGGKCYRPPPPPPGRHQGA